ncbi:MAG TPA: 50S ribosomal protein L11 methyltransferase [Candidatus Omnitrophota bacterium]|nr:50S ribosomal protein L11 methyltransferase [Candidatus Omnitrophota bacterium]
MKKVSKISGRYSVIEVALTGRNLSAKDKAAACAFLFLCGIPEKSLVSSDHKGLFRLACYIRSAAKADAIRKKYADLPYRPFTFKIKVLQQRDWLDKWKRDYHTRSLGAKFMIVPVWERKKFKHNRRLPIFLEPGSAFGSGYHETTRLMIRLLESIEGKFHDFLDIGTGTGILSIAASKLGASRVVGFDNDKPSTLVAGKNFALNRCENGRFFCAQLKSVKIPGRFEAVGANLLSKTLLQYRARIAGFARRGGYLLVSGIGIGSLEAFRKRFSNTHFKCLKILRGRGWAAALYKNTDPGSG